MARRASRKKKRRGRLGILLVAVVALGGGYYVAVRYLAAQKVENLRTALLEFGDVTSLEWDGYTVGVGLDNATATFVQPRSVVPSDLGDIQLQAETLSVAVSPLRTLLLIDTGLSEALGAAAPPWAATPPIVVHATAANLKAEVEGEVVRFGHAEATVRLQELDWATGDPASAVGYVDIALSAPRYQPPPGSDMLTRMVATLFADSAATTRLEARASLLRGLITIERAELTGDLLRGTAAGTLQLAPLIEDSTLSLSVPVAFFDGNATPMVKGLGSGVFAVEGTLGAPRVRFQARTGKEQP